MDPLRNIQIVSSIDDEKCAKYDELIIHGVSRTKMHRRTPPAASCASAANWRSTAPVGPARGIGEWPLERARVRSGPAEIHLRFARVSCILSGRACEVNSHRLNEARGYCMATFGQLRRMHDTGMDERLLVLASFH
jgi:hypothetical protein